MNKKKAIILSVASVIVGIGFTVVSAQTSSNQLDQSQSKDSSTMTVKQSPTVVKPVSKSDSVAPTPNNTSPATSPTSEQVANTPADTEDPTPPAPVIITSSANRTETSGLHKDYYCDITYSDGSTEARKIGESNDAVDSTGAMRVSAFNPHCDQYIGKVKS